MASIVGRLKRRIAENRRRLESELADSPRRRLFSPVYYGLHETTAPLIDLHARGRFIDLGCGDMPFRNLIEPSATSYDSLDLMPGDDAITYTADIQNMAEIPDASYESALCLEVLEHLPDPFRAAREIMRVLSPGGTLIASVPHLSRIHEAPNDYYRFTEYGFRELLEKAGFQVELMQRRGGLATFLGHQISVVWLGTLWRIPIVAPVAWWLNSWLVTRLCAWIDARAGGSLFPVGYTALARKPGGSGS